MRAAKSGGFIRVFVLRYRGRLQLLLISYRFDLEGFDIVEQRCVKHRSDAVEARGFTFAIYVQQSLYGYIMTANFRLATHRDLSSPL